MAAGVGDLLWCRIEGDDRGRPAASSYQLGECAGPATDLEPTRLRRRRKPSRNNAPAARLQHPTKRSYAAPSSNGIASATACHSGFREPLDYPPGLFEAHRPYVQRVILGASRRKAATRHAKYWIVTDGRRGSHGKRCSVESWTRYSRTICHPRMNSPASAKQRQVIGLMTLQ